MKLFDALISPILFYMSEAWGVDCNGKLEKYPAELVQNKFLKWLLGVNKYCNNNVSRAETGRFPMTIAAQYSNFKFWLTFTKNEYKLSQIAYNDIKWEENKAFWRKKIKSLLEQIWLGDLWMKAHYGDIGIVNIIRQRLKDIEPVSIKHGLRTTDYGLGIKHGLGIKRGLRITDSILKRLGHGLRKGTGYEHD